MTPTSSFLTTVRLLFVVAMVMSCQAGAARGLNDYQRTVWTQQDGAPPDINGLAQTLDGWLWVGTGDGLFRFDGVSFEPYSPPGHPVFAHMRVVAMHAADNGDLYVSYFPDRVAVVRRDGRFEPLPQTQDWRRTQPLAMTAGHDGSLWTIGHGIRRFAGNRWTTVENDPVWINDAFYSLLTDQDGGIWAAAPAGTWRLNRASGHFDKVSDRTGELALAPDGAVWLMGDGSAPSIRLAPSPAGKARSARANGTQSRSGGLFAADGTLWALACPHTVCLINDTASGRVDPAQKRAAIERLSPAEPAKGQDADNILEDQEGNLWFVMHQGLQRLRPKRFLVPGFDLGELAYSVAPDGAGRVWVAQAASGKLSYLRPDGKALGPAGPPVSRIATGRDGTLLTTDGRTIWRIRGASTLETIAMPVRPDGKPIGRLLGLLDDGKRVWTAAADIGAVAWFDGKWHSSAGLGLPNRVYLSAAGGPGQLWLMRTTGELVFYDNGKQTRYDATAVGIATGIFAGEQLVLGGSDGLAMLVAGKLQPVHASEPDGLRGVTGIAVTADGDRWLNGRAGVVHVRAADWQRVVDRPDTPLRFELFGRVDGYPGRAAYQGRTETAFSDDGRHVWFVATGGIVGLDSADLRRNTVAPRPAVLEVASDDARYSTDRDVLLPPGSDNFRVRFTAPALRQPERTRFEYRLDGVDADWRAAGVRRTTSYTRVPPGHYAFRVRAVNEDGVVSTEDAVLRVAVEPTLTQSTPFRIAALLVLGAVLAASYRLRVRFLTARLAERLQIKIDERERIARTLHDTFLQTVQALVLRLSSLARLLPKDGRAYHELQTMLDDAQHVIDEGRNQVRDLRAKPGRPLQDVVNDYVGGLRDLHPEVEFALHIHGAARPLHPAAAEETTWIACEALRNAFTHANARRVLVDIAYERNMTLRIQDDGVGLDRQVADAGRRSGHWGLVGMHERARNIGAQLDITGEPGAGTTVTLRVPAAHAYGSERLTSKAA